MRYFSSESTQLPFVYVVARMMEFARAETRSQRGITGADNLQRKVSAA